MTYYDDLVRHVHAAMKKYPRSPVVMTTDTFEVVATGRNARKMASTIRRYAEKGRLTAVFQKPSSDQTFIY